MAWSCWAHTAWRVHILVVDDDFVCVEVHYTYLVHILNYTDPDSVDFRTSLVLDLREWLIPEQGCPWICSIAQDQLPLGWYAALMGFFHESLAQLQHCYYKSVHSRRFMIGKNGYVEIVEYYLSSMDPTYLGSTWYRCYSSSQWSCQTSSSHLFVTC